MEKTLEKDLRGKTALVTGASRGLGRAIAVRLGAAGALVAVNYAENAAAAAETVAEIEAAGGSAFAIGTTLGDEPAAEALAAKLSEELAARTGSGGLDILVNNIGGGDYGGILQVDQAFYDGMMSNNVRGGFFLVKALHGALRDNGRVINISSVGARLTDPGIIVYTMAKAAVDAFTRVLARELGGRGITVNAVSPGFTAGETNAHVMEDPEAARMVTDNTALARFGTPEEIADAVHMLASPAGRWVTAQVIDASGGFKL
jgi:NAD(P)-dependent dehydrogenase (short-subunit alcohol dehydrogenase family)